MGKSTILRIAAGLDADFEGFVRRPPGRLGMMFQEPRLAPWLSVADNIRLVATKGAPAPDIPSLLEEVGLRGASERWPRELSLGMARRVALARALTVAPDMLVLDEPFASLDPQLSAGLAAIVRAGASRMRTLVLLASHELDQALAIADRILILSGEPATLGAADDSWGCRSVYHACTSLKECLPWFEADPNDTGELKEGSGNRTAN